MAKLPQVTTDPSCIKAAKAFVVDEISVTFTLPSRLLATVEISPPSFLLPQATTDPSACKAAKAVEVE